MRHSRVVPVLAALASLALVGEASAHGGPGASFAAGAVHPLSGADHLLAAVTTGLWAGQTLPETAGETRRPVPAWIVPAAFAGAVAVGAVLGFSGVVLPVREAFLAGTVLLAGLLVAAAVRLPVAVAACVAAAAALVHGHAHGVEMLPGGAALPYAAGFVGATAALHGAGFLLARVLARRGSAASLRLAGAGVAATGVFLAFAA